MAKLNTQESITDYLKSQGKDSSYSARKELAESMGIKNYTGSSTQNIQLLNTLKNSSATSTINNTKADTKAETPKTNDVKPQQELPLGVSQEQYDKTQEEFKASNDVKNADKKANNVLSDLEDLVGKKNIISKDVMSALNSSFTVPSEVLEADAWLSNQLEKIQSGKTSYSDQVRDMMDKIMNREKFSYDVDTDPLFQQALASAMSSGKQAMQDTIGQASALTGGYGSTYATTAGNQAYNSFIEDAYDNLPEYYQMALNAYQAEGEEMYRQFGVVSELDDKEYNRNITAYDATYQHRNQMYNEAYTQYRDTKNDAYNMANLQLNEHGQRVNDAYNLYNATSSQADKLYEREYNSWADSINNAWKEIELYNGDAWANKNFDEGVRQYEQTYAEQQRQFNESLAEQKRQHDEQMSYNWASLNKKSGGNPEYKTPSQQMMQDGLKAYNEGRQKYNEYMASIPDSYDKSAIQEYVTGYGEDWVSDYNDYSGWTIKDDTYNGGWFFGTNWLGGGEDHNDTYTKEGFDEILTYDQIKEKINASNIPKEKKEELLDTLKKQSKK